MSDPASTVERLKRNATELIPEAELAAKLARSAGTGKPLRAKLGIDPSAPHLTLGHAVVLRKLREFQDLGHTAVLIVGDFTRRVGDPSGASDSRPLMSEADIRANMRSYKEQAFKILDPERTELRYNSEWLETLGVDGIIQLASKYTVARMLERDDFHKRFQQNRPISVLEFLYPLLQAYDSVAIEADVELGGHDQLFNLLIGRDIQREFGQEPQVVLTVELLLGLDGERVMSQSKGNYIGVDEAPGKMYGKVMSLPDGLMKSYYALLTDVPWDEVKELHPRDCKKRLARTLVAWLHDAGAAREAEAGFEQVYARGELPDELPELVLSEADLSDGRIWIVALLERGELAPSRSQARRLLQQGAVQLDGEKVTEVDAQITPHDGLVLKVGKHKFARVKITK